MGLGRRGLLTLGIAIPLMVAGCGGDNGNITNTATTGSSAGSLASLFLSPEPGSVFISRATTFRLSWQNGDTPPPTFSVTLQRFKEPTSVDPVSIQAQRTDLKREGDTYNWDLSRSNGTTLDPSGIYYVEIDSGSEQVLASYIISGERSEGVAATRAAAARATDTPDTGDSAFVHTVKVRP
jgi:hypothetical protein